MITPYIEIFASTDVESDGPHPGRNSMLSFATAVVNIDKELIATFSRNLKCLPNAKMDSRTEQFWKREPEAWNNCRKNTIEPNKAMHEYFNWVMEIKKIGRPIFTAFPLGYDWKMIDWYFHEFMGKNPYGISGLDIKSYAAAALKLGKFSNSRKRKFPKRWSNDLPHTHIAMDDAIEQGALIIDMIREVRNMPPIDNLKNLID